MIRTGDNIEGWLRWQAFIDAMGWIRCKECDWYAAGVCMERGVMMRGKAKREPHDACYRGKNYSKDWFNTEETMMGILIVIEGDEGTGKTTVSKLVAKELGAWWTFEPTHSPAGLKVRELNKAGKSDAALKYAVEDRRGHANEILHHLRQGTTVVCDRYYHSMLVLQCCPGAPLDEWLSKVPAFYNKHCQTLTPHLTFILDVSPEMQSQRLTARPGQDDWLVPWAMDRYLALNRLFPDLLRIGTSQATPETLAHRIVEHVRSHYLV